MLEQMLERLRLPAVLVAFSALWAFIFVLIPGARQVLPPALLGVARYLVAAAFVALAGAGRKSPRELLSGKTIALAVVGVSLFHLFQTVSRRSFAPPASDLLFLFTLAAPALLAAGVYRFRERAGLLEMSGMAAAMLGSIAIVANWESPSSFAPFVRFPGAEGIFLLAAVSWVAFTVLAKPFLNETNTQRQLRSLFLIGSVPLLAYGLALEDMRRVFEITVNGVFILIALGVATALLYLLWFRVLRLVSVSQAGTGILLSPVLLSGLFWVERGLNVTPLLPIRLAAVESGMLLTTVAVIVLWVAGGLFGARNVQVVDNGTELVRETTRPVLEGALRLAKTAAALLSAVSFVLAFAALFLPAKISWISGTLDNGASYSTTWQTFGYGLLGPYLLLLAAGLTLAVAMRRTEGGTGEIRWGKSALADSGTRGETGSVGAAARTAGGAGVAGRTAGGAVALAFALIVAWRFAGDTHFINWLTWLPPEIQQSIGTEYVSLQVTLLPDSLTWLSALLSVGSGMVLAIHAVLARQRSDGP